jgi:hypothetical protein
MESIQESFSRNLSYSMLRKSQEKEPAPKYRVSKQRQKNPLYPLRKRDLRPVLQPEMNFYLDG